MNTISNINYPRAAIEMVNLTRTNEYYRVARQAAIFIAVFTISNFEVGKRVREIFLFSAD
jgi:hypothetical protein